MPRISLADKPCAAAETLLNEQMKEGVRLHYKETCQYCFVTGARDVEHIEARARGGSNTLANVTLACRDCNVRKGTRKLTPIDRAEMHAHAAKAAPRIVALVEGKRSKQVTPAHGNVSIPKRAFTALAGLTLDRPREAALLQLIIANTDTEHKLQQAQKGLRALSNCSAKAALDSLEFLRQNGFLTVQ